MEASSEQRYLRPCKAGLLHERASQLQLREDIAIEEYTNAAILPVRNGGQTSRDFGGVIASDGSYVLSSIIPGWLSGYYDDCECRASSRTAVYCGRMIGQWGHFLLETITRLWFFLEHDDPSFLYVLVVREGSTPPIDANFQRFFELLGIRDRLCFLNEPVRYDKVIVPQRSFQYNVFYAKQYLDILDRVALNASAAYPLSAPSPAVYLSRGQFPRAQQAEIGLPMLDDYFRRNGYQILHPENLLLDELIVRLRAAEECASESGSLAHNFLFCRTGQHTLVAERQTAVNDPQLSIDRIRQLQNVYVDCHLTLWPICSGAGPFFLCYTDQLSRLTQDRGMKAPSPAYLHQSYFQRCTKEFQAAYAQIYPTGKSAAIPVRCTASLREAFLETRLFLMQNNCDVSSLEKSAEMLHIPSR